MFVITAKCRNNVAASHEKIQGSLPSMQGLKKQVCAKDIDSWTPGWTLALGFRKLGDSILIITT